MKKGRFLLLVLTVLASAVAGYYGWRYWQLAHDAMTTTALSVQVDRRRPFTSKDLSSIPYRYQASYTFADQEARVHNGRQAIDGSTYKRLAQRADGAPVTIYYSRSNPAISSLDPNSSRLTAGFLALLALFGWGVVISRAFNKT
jgi:Protein of unknown function (DUF3592)